MPTYIAEIARPVLGIFAPDTELDLNFEVLNTDNFFCACFIYGHGFTIHKQWQCWRAVGGYEGDADSCRVDRN